jgi:predicted lipid-binding transport protein (Tim44 family)
MGDFPHSFDIILFGLVALFLILRLRSVLGRRTGNERRRNNPFLRQAEPQGDKVSADKVIPFGQRVATPPPPTAEPSGDAVAAGIARIRGADPEFDPAHFIEGARMAFDMVVSAFASGDKAKLRPLLSDEVYRPFSAAIDERSAAKETLETRIVGLKQLDIVEAEQSGRWARVTLKIVSDQINVVRAHDGSIVDGDPEHAIEKTDFWTFARDTRSTDPNWALVTTDSG